MLILRPFIPFLVAFLSGVLLCLGLSPINFSFLAWFALAPLLVAASRVRLRETAVLAFVTIATYAMIRVGWRGSWQLFFLYQPFVWFALVCAAVGVTFCYAMRLDAKNSLVLIFIVVCVGVLGERLTSLLPVVPYFDKSLPSRNAPMFTVIFAQSVGVWGVSFLLWLSNAAIASAVVSHRKHQPRHFVFAPLVVSALLITAAYSYSAFAQENFLSNHAMRAAATR